MSTSNGTMNTGKTWIKVVLGVVLFAATLFVTQQLGIWNYRYFAPQRENVKREVFENTESFVGGKRQEITKFYNEWRKADDTEKSAIRKMVLQSFASFDIDKLTEQQRIWYYEMVNYQ